MTGRRQRTAVLRVEEVDEPVQGESRVDGETEHPRLTVRPGVGQRQRWRREQLAVLDDANPSRPLRDEEPPVWCERQAPGNFEAGGDDLDAKRGAVGGREDLTAVVRRVGVARWHQRGTRDGEHTDDRQAWEEGGGEHGHAERYLAVARTTILA